MLIKQALLENYSKVKLMLKEMKENFERTLILEEEKRLISYKQR
jgi:hypothetical protein